MAPTFVHRANIVLALSLLVGLTGFFAVSGWMERENQSLREENERRRNRSLAAPRRPMVEAEPLAVAAVPRNGLANAFVPLGRVGDLQRAQAAAAILRSGLFGDAKWPAPPNNSLAEAVNGIAIALGLSAGERAALHTAVQAGREAFQRVLVASAVVTREGDIAHIEVPEASAGLRVPFDQMQAAIAGVLGPDRYDAYVGLGASQAIERVFDKWGLAGAIVRVRRLETRYQSTVLEVPPQKLSLGERLQWGTRSRMLADRDALRAHLGPIEALVPLDL